MYFFMNQFINKIIIITAPSGAGKSTLLYMLSGIDTITSGEISLNDTRIDQVKEKRIFFFKD